MGSYLFTGGRFLDPRRDELIDGIEVLIEDALVKEVSDRPISASGARRIDIGARTRPCCTEAGHEGTWTQ